MTNVCFSICICTSGRPHELRRCLQSIGSGSRRPDSVLVSDDSRDDATAAEVQRICNATDYVLYVKGPRRGLCANRNLVVERAQSTHVSLLDDDAVVHFDFVKTATRFAGERPSEILSGDVWEDGVQLTPPTNPTFLGHFGRPVVDGEQLRNVNLNCNVFPRAAFKDARFDESIVYGYEDMDLCAQLVAKGWTIRHVPELVNSHLPPVSRRDPTRLRQAEWARLHVLRRQYFVHERRPLRGGFVLAVAIAHAAAHRLKRAVR